MTKNYIKTAWRNLMRNKSYALINVTGLAIGIAACLLIFLVIHFETSYDNFHKKKDHIYRVLTTSNGPKGVDKGSGVPFPTPNGLRLDFPQFKSVAAIIRNGGHFTVGGDNNAKKFKEDETYYAEPQFFDVFDLEWLSGDKKTALAEPNSAIITQEIATKFFGNWKDAIGKTIKYENKTVIKITGILKNFPANTDFPLKIVMSYATLQNKDSDFHGNLQDWVSVFSQHNCFVVLPDNANVNTLNAQLTAFIKKHKPAEYVKEAGLQLQPLSDMHYDTDLDVYSAHAFSKQLINAFSLIGIFLLAIACVNFVNLATAQAVNRSKEVGIRKVLGSRRGQLIIQFITETFIITFFAVALAIGIAELTLPLLNGLLEIKLSGSFLGDPVIVIFLVALVIAVTFLSGFYPALVLSGFNPIAALKNRVSSAKTSGISLRRVLVVLQFGIAQVLVIGTLVIISQMDLFKNTSLGFAKDAVITVPVPGDSVSKTKFKTFQNQLLQQAGVKDVSYSFTSPSDYSNWSSDFRYNNAKQKTDFGANLKWADAEYFKLYKLEFVAGQAYTQSDTMTAYVVNETLVKKLGIKDPHDVIGKYVNLWDDKHKYHQIVGVVKDFNVTSLRSEIPPVLMSSWKDMFQVANVKIQPSNVKETLASVEKLWNSNFPDYLYEYQFLDDKIAGFYKNETQLSQLYTIFAGIAIFISCLGLYGLVSFMALQRTREVGIRKTLGASVANIVYLFSKEFTVLILVAFVVSAPVGWYFMNKWLQDFTYKIHLGPGIFILAILASVAIAWATVGYKAVQAALANPVKSLRSE